MPCDILAVPVSPTPGLTSTAPVANGVLRGLPLRAALMRGAVITAANWPVILIQFIMVSLCRVTVAVPVVGGAFMVAVLSGSDINTVFASDISSAAGLVAAALLHRPAALVGFAAAILIAVAGTGVISWVTSAGVMATLARGEQVIGDTPHTPLRVGLLQDAGVWTVDRFLTATSTFGRRFIGAGACLYVAYLLVAGSAVAVVALAAGLAARPGWSIVLPLAAVGATGGVLVVIAILQLAHALVQAIMLTDDCRLRAAIARLGPFVLHDARQVLGIFGIVLVLLVLGTAASVLATAGLALVAWVPLIGIAGVPLQLAAWLVRGLVFRYVDLSAWSAYQGQYRRHTVHDAAYAGRP